MAEESPKKPSGTSPTMDSMRGDRAPEIVRDGVVFPWMVSEGAIQALRDYDVKDDDVWITTYPKAGTNLFYNDSLILEPFLFVNFVNHYLLDILWLENVINYCYRLFV